MDLSSPDAWGVIAAVVTPVMCSNAWAGRLAGAAKMLTLGDTSAIPAGALRLSREVMIVEFAKWKLAAALVGVCGVIGLASAQPVTSGVLPEPSQPGSEAASPVAPGTSSGLLPEKPQPADTPPGYAEPITGTEEPLTPEMAADAELRRQYVELLRARAERLTTAQLKAELEKAREDEQRAAAMREYESLRNRLEQLVGKYPQTPAADLARKMLRSTEPVPTVDFTDIPPTSAGPTGPRPSPLAEPVPDLGPGSAGPPSADPLVGPGVSPSPSLPEPRPERNK